jgi:uncharacterized protein YbbK (DUF523 family)
MCQEKVNKPTILVSACLIGKKCRYNGGDKLNKEVLKLLENKNYIAVCPEVLGGLPVPREPATRYGDRVITNFTKRDVTSFFKIGALKTVQIVKKYNIEKAILKSKSPSCGENGITAESLKKRGVKLIWF